jgi:tetratricopeptide (TPR) repeat protein
MAKKLYTVLFFSLFLAIFVLDQRTSESVSVYPTSINQTSEAENTSVIQLNDLGWEFYDVGNYSEALVSFDKVLAREPGNIEALDGKASALNELGRSEEALLIYDKALAVDPNYISALINKGHVLSNLDRDKDALVLFDRALAIDQNDTIGLYDKGWSLYKLGH